MKTPDIEALIPLLPYQQRAVESKSRYLWCCWSRQVGKTHALTLRRIIRGMKRNRNQIILSAGERQSREAMRHCHKHLRAIQAACDMTFDAGKESTLAGTEFGVVETRVKSGDGSFDFRIIALPANPMTARGYTGDVLLDEFALHLEDEEIWSSVFPISSRGGGEIDTASTPFGEDNRFARLRGNKLFDHQTVTIHDAIAQGLPLNAEGLKAAIDSESAWRREYECDFTAKDEQWIPDELIAAAMDGSVILPVPTVPMLAPVGSAHYAGYDPGRRRNPACLWVWLIGLDGIIRTSAVHVMRGATFDDQEQVCRSILDRHDVSAMAIDAGGLGMQLSERLCERYGPRLIQIAPTNPSNADLATRTRMLFERGLLRLPDDLDVRKDFASIRQVLAPGGMVRYVAPDTVAGHADRFWAASLGLRSANERGALSDHRAHDPTLADTAPCHIPRWRSRLDPDRDRPDVPDDYPVARRRGID